MLPAGALFCPVCGGSALEEDNDRRTGDALMAAERIRGRCPCCFHKTGESAETCPVCGAKVRARNRSFQLPAGSLIRNGESLYLIGQAIGQGGFGITYTGWDVSLAQRVAVKEYFPADCAARTSKISERVTVTAEREADYRKGLEDFIREARALASFSGVAGIVKVLARFEANNTSYIIMEYLDGIRLDRYIREFGTLSFGDSVRLMTPILRALDQIHKVIIHRDISPQNIMILQNGEARLLDFGAARKYVTDGGTSDLSRLRFGEGGHFSVILKHGYAPYEQYFEKGDQGPWTDVYGLGATFYYMLTGSAPYDARDRRKEDKLLPPSSLAKDLTPAQDAVIMKALALEPGDRYQSAAELERALNGAAAGKKPGTGKLLFGAIAVLALILTALVGTMVRKSAAPPQSKYMVLTGDMTWEQADRACREKGGHLMTIGSEEEFQRACEIAEPLRYDYFWLGARLESPDRTWEETGWITGEEWTYANWYPGEPSGSDTNGNEELFLCLWHSKYEDEDIGWTFNDAADDIIGDRLSRKGKVACICEFD